MYTPHFKMTSQPFAERLSVDHVLVDERLAQGLARLEFLIQSGTIALVTGQTGVGKSTLIRCFLKQMKPNQVYPVYLYLTPVKDTSFLSQIVTALGEVPKRGKEKLFGIILNKTEKIQATTLLVIDEAHLLSPESLTDVRLLVSSAMDEKPPLKIVLIGQKKLKMRVKQDSHADLNGRISVKIGLHPFTRDETIAYINHQMKTAGSSDKVFEQDVKTMIHDFAGGIPREINNIATACLMAAASAKAQKIDTDILNHVIDEFK
jgi:general secretion pathway protein A